MRCGRSSGIWRDGAMTASTVDRAEGQTFAGESLLVRYVNSSSCRTRSSRCRSRCSAWWSRRRRAPVTSRTVRLVVLAFTGGALGGDGIQPDRRPRVRRAESAHRGARAAARRADAGPGVGRGRRRGRCCSCSPPGRSTRSASRSSPVALAWVLLYSYTKRFTWWPHLVARARAWRSRRWAATSRSRAHGASRGGCSGARGGGDDLGRPGSTSSTRCRT